MLGYELKKKGYAIPDGILTVEELIDALAKCKATATKSNISEVSNQKKATTTKEGHQPILKLDHVNYVYSPGTAYEKHALKDINLDIFEGELIGVIGHTGSGKSTLIQHLNGLSEATEGALYYKDDKI